MKRRKLALFFASITIAFTAAEDFSKRMDDLRVTFNISDLRSEVDRIKKTSEDDPLKEYHLAKAIHCLILVQDDIEGESKGTTTLAMEALEYGRKAAASPALLKEEMAENYYVMAALYDRIIRDASTWLSYNGERLKYLKLCLAEEPAHIEANLIRVNTLLYAPANAGGDPTRGDAELAKLYEEQPESQTVLMAMAWYQLSRAETEKAETFLKEIVTLNPRHLGAREMLEELLTMKESLTIRDIAIVGAVKTSRPRILSKARRFIGAAYTFENKQELISLVQKIRSISGCDVTATRREERKVDLVLRIKENNTSVFGAVGVMDSSLDYEKDPVFGGYPALLYMDQNFLGTADSLSAFFAGPFLGLDYVHTGLFGDSLLDLKLHWESMLLSWANPLVPVEEGRDLWDQSMESTYHIASVDLGWNLPIGLSVYAGLKGKYQDWSETDGKTAEDFTLPQDGFIYGPTGSIALNTVGRNTGSKMDILSGFKVAATGEALFALDYDAWGSAENLYEHDENPSWKFVVGGEYDRKIGEKQNLRFALTYMTGWNLYKSERWATGKNRLLIEGPSLNGFYSGEFLFTSGALANLFYSINMIPRKLTFYGEYDLFSNQDDSELYHGFAVGLGLKLPFDIELTGQVGVGINAERQDGPGLEIDLLIRRLWFF